MHVEMMIHVAGITHYTISIMHIRVSGLFACMGRVAGLTVLGHLYHREGEGAFGVCVV